MPETTEPTGQSATLSERVARAANRALDGDGSCYDPEDIEMGRAALHVVADAYAEEFRCVCDGAYSERGLLDPVCRDRHDTLAWLREEATR